MLAGLNPIAGIGGEQPAKFTEPAARPARRSGIKGMPTHPSAGAGQCDKARITRRGTVVARPSTGPRLGLGLGWRIPMQNEKRAKAGLEILYARHENKDRLADVAQQDVPGELRERFWIRQAEDVGIESRTRPYYGIRADYRSSIPRRIERHELGRTRNEPGDGFRYAFHSGTAGTGGRAEWFEVTEVFEGVEAKDIEAFMRIENGGEAGFDFDPDRFVRGLDMGTPCRAAQRRAADKVIAAVKKKVNKASYEGMWREHGYGTLIVGLPLWFATTPTDPLRVENVIDDFMTRVGIGLEPYARQLRKKTCPFWRIVVVWMVSLESVREWSSKAGLDVHDDPAYRGIGSLLDKVESIKPLWVGLWSGLMSTVEAGRADGDGSGELKLYVARARPEKKGKETFLQLPPAVKQFKRQVDDYVKQNREKLLERVKWRAKGRLLLVRCFLRAYGLGGLARWAVAGLSPRRRRIRRFAMPRQARRLYRASQRRQARPSRTLPANSRSVH